jgi:hypothetical protein
MKLLADKGAARCAPTKTSPYVDISSKTTYYATTTADRLRQMRQLRQIRQLQKPVIVQLSKAASLRDKV